MIDLDFNRSTRFVSLDTHAANDSLVVTYEILVTVSNSTTGQELSRANKRDQFQISISALDSFKPDDLGRNGDDHIKLNLNQIGEKILQKCPILTNADRGQTLEVIHLNLLYLLKRKQSQTSSFNRPPSSGRLRSESATPSRRLKCTRQNSATCRINEEHSSRSGQRVCLSPLEIYQHFFEQEIQQTDGGISFEIERLDSFIEHLDKCISQRELKWRYEELPCQPDNFDAQIEGLYGDMEAKLKAVASIRRSARDNKRLLAISSDRLLICAMLRTLRNSDAGARSLEINESLLYCLIKLTLFEDVFNSIAFGGFQSSSEAGGGNDFIDLVRVVIDLLESHSKWLAANSEIHPRLLSDSFNYTNSLCVILNNYLRLSCSVDQTHNVNRKLPQQHGIKLTDIITNLLTLLAKNLSSDTKSILTDRSKHIRTIMMEVLKIARQLSIYKGFISLLRPKPKLTILVNSLINIINILQQTMPVGESSKQQFPINTTNLTNLCEVYELELATFKLINNLIYDTRIRTQLLRKNVLLKCVLRSLVIFLASSRKMNTLKPFDRSSILMVPFKSLYELSCREKARHELFKSRIIIKCLLEYLLTSSVDFKSSIQISYSQTAKENPQRLTRSFLEGLDLNEGDQIVLNTRNVDQFILSVWMNLSSNPKAPIYSSNGDETLLEPLCDYIDLAIANLKLFIVKCNQPGTRDEVRFLREAHLLTYVHTKLLRNIFQFLTMDPIGYRIEWTETLTEVVDIILRNKLQFLSNAFIPLLIECLAALTNMIEKMSSNEESINQRPPELIGSILDCLFQENCLLSVNNDGEYQMTREVELDDLLLVAINFLGSLAKHKELCYELKKESTQVNIIKIISSTIKLKRTDTEMLVSCLFTLSQLMIHSIFLKAFGSAIDQNESADKTSSNIGKTAIQLVDQLCWLVMSPDTAVVKLSGIILNELKQYEEFQSMSDSLTCRKRFEAYNNKWLETIRSHGEDPTRWNMVDGKLESDVSLDSIAESREHELELEQLRTINEDETKSASGQASESSSARMSLNNVEGGLHMGPSAVESEEFEDRDEHEEDDDEEDETISEPDLNVIDSMSMIRHLTNRREFRAELTRR